MDSFSVCKTLRFLARRYNWFTYIRTFIPCKDCWMSQSPIGFSCYLRMEGAASYRRRANRFTTFQLVNRNLTGKL